MTALTPTGASVAVTGPTKRFRTGGVEITAANGLSLQLAPGALVAVTGPSGSGKSTLPHLIGEPPEPTLARANSLRP
ncbi:ATP-binding cassette domain-containing protein [Catellatospora tritici]|uniref:ATP-binding cassette domain-containing protein n=1 Tax=Catellatospora tritici TaxID=2851566 RepID=UPI001C2DC738|nr:ATP-binding cassette domain-containing protein [Catellatospora tritici]